MVTALARPPNRCCGLAKRPAGNYDAVAKMRDRDPMDAFRFMWSAALALAPTLVGWIGTVGRADWGERARAAVLLIAGTAGTTWMWRSSHSTADFALHLARVSDLVDAEALRRVWEDATSLLA